MKPGGICALIVAMAWLASATVPTSCLMARVPDESTPSARKHGSVRIQRDSYGVPHIFADTTYGLYYGFGHALAEDQLFQMEMLKRTSEGRVAEVLGARYLEQDKASRSRFELASLAAQFEEFSTEDKAIFQGYADGFNARIADVLSHRDAKLPKEFMAYGFLPERWTPIDILAVYEHSMALRYSDPNWELGNLALLTRLKKDHDPKTAWALFEQLRWVHDDDAPTTIAAIDEHKLPIPTFAAAGFDPAQGLLPNTLKGLEDSVLYDTSAPQLARRNPDEIPRASNLWALNANRIAGADAVLVNGPQMGNFTPGYIWAVGLHGAGFDLVGSGPMGSPWLIFGTNGDIGWGATAGLGDTVDEYQEHLNPNDSHQYFFKGRYRAMRHRVEIIAVKNAAPVKIDIYATVHGTVDLFDLKAGVAYSRHRSWEGAEVRSLVAWIHAMKARNYQEWRNKISDVAISINNYLVDENGSIAYQFLGRFPKRPANQDFRLPANGDGSMEWQGFYDPRKNPYVLNPTGSLIANWNNKPQPGYNSSDFVFWGRTDRLTEINAALVSKNKLTPDELFQVVQRISFKDTTARYILPLIESHRPSWMGDRAADRAAGILARWNGNTVDPASQKVEPGYILYKAFVSALLEDVFAPIVPKTDLARDQFRKDFLSFTPAWSTMGVEIATAALSDRHAGNALLAGRSAAKLVEDALVQSLRMVVSEYGEDPAAWSEKPKRHAFSTDNYAGIPQTTPDNAVSLPLMMNRGTENNRIVFAGGKVTYCDVTPPGQSGFIAPDGRRSAHYSDQLKLYLDFTCKPQWLYRQDIDRDTKSSQVLNY